MQFKFVTKRKDKKKWGSVLAVFAMAALTGVLTFAVHTAQATTPAQLIVDDDGKATAYNCNSSTITPHTTVSSAVTAASAGNTIKVCPGTYGENVVIDKALTLRGAKADSSVNSRTFGDSNESTVTGLVTIQVPDVRVEGFSLTNPNQGLGVLVKTTGNNAVVKKNILKTVGSSVFVGPTVGIYLELGPDNVQVVGNKISDVQSQTGSAQGMLVGDSTSVNPSLSVRLDDNKVSDITSATRGAYGIQVNNGASTNATATGYTEAKIRGNEIKNLSGSWAHAIGLEGETPNVEVKSNVISSLTDINPTPANDTVGVFFESNPFFFTGEVNMNSFNVGPAGTGIAVHPTLATQYPSLSVDGECNWWGASNGPGLVAAGNGAKVGSNVDHTPWLKSSNINKGCGDRDHHDRDKHRGDWGEHDNDSWRDN